MWAEVFFLFLISYALPIGGWGFFALCFCFKLIMRFDYSEYLQSEHWKQVRSQKLRSVGYACEIKKEKYMNQKYTDTELLNFVALYVQEINTLECPKGENVEMVYYPTDDDMRVIRRKGGTELEAFRKCVAEGLSHINRISK